MFMFNSLLASNTYDLPAQMSVPPFLVATTLNLSLDSFTLTLPSLIGTTPSMNLKPPK